MHNELANIIYKFFANIFLPSSQASNINALDYGVSMRYFYTSLYGASDNYFENLMTAFGGNSSNVPQFVLCWILTSIVLVLLFFCLIKLFKRIFNLIFKLFKLN